MIGFLFMVAILLLLPALGDLASGWKGWVLGLAGWALYYSIIDFFYQYPTQRETSD